MKTRQSGMAHSNTTLVIDENEPMLILSNDRPFSAFFQTIPYAVVPFFDCLQKKSGAVKYKNYKSNHFMNA